MGWWPEVVVVVVEVLKNVDVPAPSSFRLGVTEGSGQPLDGLFRSAGVYHLRVFFLLLFS